MNNNKILVITSFNKKLYEEYAHRFVESYNWPYDLKIYTEELFNINKDYEMLILNDDCKNFVERNKDKKFKDYITDGVRFSYKVYSITQAGINSNCDILIWVDADSVFYKPLTIDFIKTNLYKEDKMMTYLGRGEHYSECGFLLWNLKHKDTIDYFKEIKKMYDKDLIYKEKEQHDSYIWDLIRKKFEVERNTINIDIGDKKVGHVQARSILGSLYDHTKGPKRKQIGKSPEARV
jgi:hypothetical protein